VKTTQIQTLDIQALNEVGMRRLNARHRGLPYSYREEVLQDSLIDLMGVVERGGRVENPAAFLAVIVDRTAATAATKLAELRENETPVGLTYDLEDRNDKADLPQPAAVDYPFFAASFDAAVRALPKELRDAFIAIDIRGLSQDEAAPLLDVPQQTLSRRLDLARDLVKEAVA